MGCTATGVTAVSAQLLTDVKNQLNIGWDDNATDNKIANLIQNGVAYLNDKLGETGDYSAPGYPRALLFEYVRYARDEALDVFENNYTALILAMQNQRKVAAYGVESTESAG